MASRAVELGFAEEAVEPWRLRREQFPSKVGGRPAWLGECGLPGPSELRCGVCGRPCAFLLQLYAPLPDRPDAFHRGLFLFACRQPACYRPAGPAPGSLRGMEEASGPGSPSSLSLPAKGEGIGPVVGSSCGATWLVADSDAPLKVAGFRVLLRLMCVFGPLVTFSPLLSFKKPTTVL